MTNESTILPSTVFNRRSTLQLERISERCEHLGASETSPARSPKQANYEFSDAGQQSWTQLQLTECLQIDEMRSSAADRQQLAGPEFLLFKWTDITMTPGLKFRQALAAGPIAIPGAGQALIARLIERTGFSAMYLSGAAFSAGQLALPDVGLFTLSELVEETRRLTRASSLPLLVDADTGFGEALMVERTVHELTVAGAAAIQLEDQELPKRCGHLSGKSLVSIEVMCTKLRAVVAAKTDATLMIVARTDARSVEGLDQVIARARAYVAAGAEAIFPEALQSVDEFAAVRAAIKVPLIANMTEFGQTPLIDMSTWKNLGYNGVLYPVSVQRAAWHAAEQFLQQLAQTGTQQDFLPQMLTRQQLYDLLDYAGYEARDQHYFSR